MADQSSGAYRPRSLPATLTHVDPSSSDGATSGYLFSTSSTYCPASSNLGPSLAVSTLLITLGSVTLFSRVSTWLLSKLLGKKPGSSILHRLRMTRNVATTRFTVTATVAPENKSLDNAFTMVKKICHRTTRLTIAAMLYTSPLNT